MTFLENIKENQKRAQMADTVTLPIDQWIAYLEIMKDQYEALELYRDANNFSSADEISELTKDGGSATMGWTAMEVLEQTEKKWGTLEGHVSPGTGE